MATVLRYLCAALMLVSGTCFAQSSTTLPGSPQWFFQVVPARAPADLASPAGQRYLQTLDAVGRYDLRAALTDPLSNVQACTPLARSSSIEDGIVNLARNTTIVIVNEVRGDARHRETIRQLAAALRAEGYEYFAAEAFSQRVDRYPGEAFVRTDAGYEVLEPTFGQLVRTAKSLGYRLVPYAEDSGPRRATAEPANEREKAERQADNLIARIFGAQPGAKVLIHAMDMQAAEAPVPTSGEQIGWMAARLKAKTGVDPLTVDQVHCASLNDAATLSEIAVELPSGAYDIAVAHTAAALFRGRPQWRIDAGDIAIELPEPFVGAEVRTLIEARYESEPVDTVPMDRLLLNPGERLPLLLRAGRIRLVQYFEDGRAPATVVLNVR